VVIKMQFFYSDIFMMLSVWPCLWCVDWSRTLRSVRRVAKWFVFIINMCQNTMWPPPPCGYIYMYKYLPPALNTSALSSSSSSSLLHSFFLLFQNYFQTLPIYTTVVTRIFKFTFYTIHVFRYSFHLKLCSIIVSFFHV